MSDLNSQFITLRHRFHATITVIKPHLIWEITIPKILRTTFAQTSLVLEQRNHFYYLHDNGSCNNTAAFHLSNPVQHLLFQLKIKNNVRFVKNRYHEIHFMTSRPQDLVNSVQQLTHFLVALDRILRRNL